MKNLISFAVAFWLSATLPASATEPVGVLGLPLGGKITPSKACPQKRGTADYRLLCWVHSPVNLSGGTKWGMLGVPGSDSRPKWAAYAMFDAHVTKDGTLDSFDVLTARDDQYQEIFDSVSRRFGQPARYSQSAAKVSTATWRTVDVEVRLECTPGAGCKTTFSHVSAQSRMATTRDEAIQRAKDAARPASP